MDENQRLILAALLAQRGKQFAEPQQTTLAQMLQAINMRMNQRQPEEMPRGPVNIEGGGAIGGGLLSGGGRATLEMPNTLAGILSLYAGGGGAVGSVNTPQGQQQIREFQPEVGFQYRRPFF